MVQDKDYLAHHGVKGMKWGIRRFQNEDGTLTALGKKHYGVGELSKEAKKKAKEKARVAKAKARAKTKEEKVAKKKARAEEASEKRVIKATHNLSDKKRLNKLSDEELKKVISRLELEKKYRDTMLAVNPNAKKYFSWKEQGAKIADNLIQKISGKAIDSAVKKLFVSSEDREKSDLERLKREKETYEVKRGIMIAKDKYKEYKDEKDKKEKESKEPKETKSGTWKEVKDKKKWETNVWKEVKNKQKWERTRASEAAKSSKAKKGKKAAEKGLTLYQYYRVSADGTEYHID